MNRQDLITAALVRAQKIQETNIAYATRSVNVEQNGGQSPKGLREDMSNTASKREAWKPALTHYVFCGHMKPYWKTCSACKRDKALSEANRKMFFSHIVNP